MCRRKPRFGLQGRVYRPPRRKNRVYAQQTRERQEREAVRGAQGQGYVEGASGEDRELPRRLEPGRQEVPLGELQEHLLARRDDGSEESRRPQGRQGRCEKELELFRRSPSHARWSPRDRKSVV